MFKIPIASFISEFVDSLDVLHRIAKNPDEKSMKTVKQPKIMTTSIRVSIGENVSDCHGDSS
jgi:hypothetical protein